MLFCIVFNTEIKCVRSPNLFCLKEFRQQENVPRTHEGLDFYIKFPLFVIGTTLYICMSNLPLGQVSSLLLTKKTTMFTVYVDMRILIDKSLKHFYMLQESLILCKHGNILLSLKWKGKHNLKLFYYIHIVEITTNKGENSYKLTEFRKQGIYCSTMTTSNLLHYGMFHNLYMF